jgi:hypothetical protein
MTPDPEHLPGPNRTLAAARKGDVGLADVDADCGEAVRAAPDRQYGRVRGGVASIGRRPTGKGLRSGAHSRYLGLPYFDGREQ